jgi:DNA-directed RNA polymerase subunit RPC12/RpoP
MRRPFADEYPKLLLEWDFEKNDGINPNDFTSGSDQKIWWKCKLGHSWKTAINCRTGGTSCPYCFGKKAWPGFNDLLTLEPQIAAEWDYDNNNDARPEHFTRFSNKKVWWKCKNGHSFFMMIINRTYGRQRCPYCFGYKVLQGFNDLVTIKALFVSEWDYDKNGDLRPEQFSKGSNKKVWWKCARGHSWKAAIFSREKHGCPSCYGNTFTPGVNDLLTINPKLANDWDYDKNGNLRPEHVSTNKKMKVWWRCKKEHSWKSVISNRNNGNGCPYCANKAVLKGFNDLLHLAPELCEQWDWDANAPLRPDEVTARSGKYVWWKCMKGGHSWEARIADRYKGNGCPHCAGKIVISGDNDLQTLKPELADEWDHIKNAPLLPTQVTTRSGQRVWWLCRRGHSFKTAVYNRYYGTGCPYCAGNLPIIGETDLATVHPELVVDWDSEKNKEKTPRDFTSRSNEKVWWICKEGHSWQSAIFDRHKGTRCPYCVGKLAIPGITDAATLYPNLLDEWDSQENKGAGLQNLLPNSGKKYWWKCKRGHKWKTSVQARSMGNSCPRCKGKTPMKTRLVR